MINRSIRGLLLLLAVVLGYSSSVQAQIKTTTLNNNTVAENSIVVKISDEAVIVKGKAYSPKQMTATLRTQLNATIGRTIKAQGVEEWIVSGNMEDAISRLNRIPGVQAFPNYVFYRDEMKSTPVDFSNQITINAIGENPFPSLTAIYGDELVIGGDFTGGFTSNWVSFLADWQGTNADITVMTDSLDDGGTNDFASVTNITGPTGEAWYIQLINEFSDSDIDQMEIGGAYEISFTAWADSGVVKDIAAYFGQNFDAFVPVFNEVVTVDDQPTMFTFQFYLYEKFYSPDGVIPGMKLSLEAGFDASSVYFDDVSIRQVNTPITAAPSPDVDSSMVISIFSDSYDDVPVDTYRTDWSSATFEVDTVDGNAFLSYSDLDFVGIETVSNQIDITEMSNLHFNVWTPNTDAMRIKLVDFGPDGAFGGGDDSEHEIEFTGYPKSTWLYADISLNAFEGLQNTTNIAQIIFSANPTGESILAIDNLYFYDNGLPTNDPLLTLQYGLNNDGSFNPGYSLEGADVDAFAAWEMTTGSDDVVMVVYDDGVDFSHPDLYENRWVNPGEDLNGDGMISDDEWNGIDDDGNGYVDDFWGWSPAYNDNSFLNPGSFHGTHVAGILGAQGNNGIGVSGVAQDVKIINVMIFNEWGGTDAITIMAGYQYITDLLDVGVDITGINQSWGGGGYLDLESDQQFVSVMTDFALDHAEHAALWVVSAGNSASNRDDLPFYSYPNNIQSPNIITVASSDDADNLSGFSDFGYFTVDVSAPGSSILSTLPPSITGLEYAYLSGTSMATPHVSGILALAKSMYPDEDGYALMTRLLAGNEPVSSLDGVTGAGGRVSALGALDVTAYGNSGDIAGGSTNQFQRTFVDGDAMETTGIVNNTDGDVTVQSLTITGDNADNFYLITDELPTLAAGEAFGILVGFDNQGMTGDLTATLDVQTSAGGVGLALIGHEQGFAFVDVTPGYENFGSVPYGEELNSTFTVSNIGNADMEFSLFQAMFYYDLEWSNYVSDLVSFEKEAAPINKVGDNNEIEFLNDITAKVMLERGDRERPVIKANPTPNETAELAGPEWIWWDDLNDADTVDMYWDVLDFSGGEGDVWNLVDIGDGEGGVNNVFMFGDFFDGYADNSVTVAATPTFDFSGYEAGRGPAYLSFDVDVALEDYWDEFFLNIVVDGVPYAYIGGTNSGEIINYGGYYRVWVDISAFSGFENVEFWFIATSDFSYAGGFGALFDNVGIIVDDFPYFTSDKGGELAPGESMDIDYTIRTELLPPGDFVMFTDIFANGFISYYGNGGNYAGHVAEFSARNVALQIDPMEIWLGEVSTEEPLSFSFDAYNAGTVDVDYFARTYVFWDQPDDFLNSTMTESRDKALERFAASDKGEGEGIDLVKHRNTVLANAEKRSVARAEVRSSDRPRMTPAIDAMDIYFEDFETGELSEEWTVFDGSFGLGNTFEVENFGTDENPFHMLDVGDQSENGTVWGYYILNNTYTLAFSPTFDLSDVPISEAVIMEFTYSFLLESGWDFASVWVGVETDEGIDLIYAGSSEDAFFNDGGFHRTGFNISQFAGQENVFLAFLVETDQSVQSAWASWDDLDVYTADRLAYVDPAEGVIDSAATQSFNVTVNTPWLWPGYYAAVTFIDYYSNDLFVSRYAEQVTHFEIPNMKPIANDDFTAVLEGSVIDVEYEMIGFILSNDFDVDGNIWLYDIEEPYRGQVKYTLDGPMYVAPYNFDGWDWFRYVITDGQLTDTATVFISVRNTPHFPTGSDQQYVFLEDESLTLSTVRMAAGVGGQDADLFVWASPMHDAVSISHDSDNHTVTFSADDNFFGQTDAMFYVGHEGEPMDSMMVSIIITPINDAPTAEFSANVDGSTVTFADMSSDAIDMQAGGIVAWEWNFGDGTSSTDQNPTYDYGTTGDFTVTLTVTDNGGLTDTFEENVNIMSVSNEVDGAVPTEFAIEQNYPNPFNPSTNINYSLPEASKVSIVVYDMLGQRVAEIVNSEKSAGYHTVTFDASALSSGMYVYQIKAGAFSQTKKMMLIK
ncbi:MAG: S8 family serine peptidase [Balneolaceae bacterium]|nr:S8 family serine peptidase [Balneolaceae bacterium]